VPNSVGTSFCPIILCGAADFHPGRKEARMGSDLIRSPCDALPKVLLSRSPVLSAFRIRILGHSGPSRCATVSETPMSVKRVGSSSVLGPRVLCVTDLVACNSTCSGCAVGPYGGSIPLLCITHALKNVDQSCPRGVPIMLVSRLSSCIEM